MIQLIDIPVAIVIDTYCKIRIIKQVDSILSVVNIESTNVILQTTPLTMEECVKLKDRIELIQESQIKLGHLKIED